jgi:hypothetical protein
MHRVVALDFVDGQLQALPIEIVLTVEDAVGPGQQRLAAPVIGRLRHRKAVQHGPAVDAIVSQAATNLDDGGPLPA